MKSRSYDFYGGLLISGQVAGNAQPAAGAGEPIKEIPVGATRIVGVIIPISTFGPQLVWSGSIWSGKLTHYSGLHVDVWLSQEGPVPKQSDGIIAKASTGDSGSANLPIPDLDIEIVSRKLVINYWAHNMRKDPSDFHTGPTIFYES